MAVVPETVQESPAILPSGIAKMLDSDKVRCAAGQIRANFVKTKVNGRCYQVGFWDAMLKYSESFVGTLK